MYPTEIGVFRSTRSWKKGIPFCTLQGIIYDYTTDNWRISILLFFSGHSRDGGSHISRRWTSAHIFGRSKSHGCFCFRDKLISKQIDPFPVFSDSRNDILLRSISSRSTSSDPCLALTILPSFASLDEESAHPIGNSASVSRSVIVFNLLGPPFGPPAARSYARTRSNGSSVERHL